MNLIKDILLDSNNLNKDGIRIHTDSELVEMKLSCKLAAETLDMIGDYVEPGVSTDKINSLCHEFMLDNGAKPATLGYRGFPKSCCISINHVVCHGIPGPKILKESDILNIDVTCILNGWFGDSSRMYIAGTTSKKASRLIEVTYNALLRGIEVVKPGNTFGDIGEAIQKYVESKKMSVVRDFCGHGLEELFIQHQMFYILVKKILAHFWSLVCFLLLSLWLIWVNQIQKSYQIIGLQLQKTSHFQLNSNTQLQLRIVA